jgi:hypothetical protein
MATTSTELFQGDSSDVLSVQVYNGATLITNLAGYTGTLAVVTVIGSTPVMTKAMSVVSSAFQVQLTPAETAALTAGAYKIIMQVENGSIPFKKESQIDLIVKQQGYTS